MLAAHANDDGSLVDMDGHALPPCIVMERGTSLDMWAQSGKPDRFQAATVCLFLVASLVLMEIHEREQRPIVLAQTQDLSYGSPDLYISALQAPAS